MKLFALSMTVGVALAGASIPATVGAQELYGFDEARQFRQEMAATGQTQDRRKGTKVASRSARGIGTISAGSRGNDSGSWHRRIYDTHEKVGYDGVVNP